MKVVILGATGFVGIAILNEALDRGHTVLAIARNPEKLHPRDHLITKTVDVYHSDTLATLVQGYDAVISAFNPGWADPNIYDNQLRGTTSIISALKKAHIKRVLWVGGAGGLEVKQGVRVVDAPEFPPQYKAGALATLNALEQLQDEPELEWSFLAPSAELKPGKRTGEFRLGKGKLLVDENGHSSISVEDYAVAMINELENPAHVRERFTVGY